jgi:hypothetical protein
MLLLTCSSKVQAQSTKFVFFFLASFAFLGALAVDRLKPSHLTRLNEKTNRHSAIGNPSNRHCRSIKLRQIEPTKILVVASALILEDTDRDLLTEFY